MCSCVCEASKLDSFIFMLSPKRNFFYEYKKKSIRGVKTFNCWGFLHYFKFVNFLSIFRLIECCQKFSISISFIKYCSNASKIIFHTSKLFHWIHKNFIIIFYL